MKHWDERAHDRREITASGRTRIATAAVALFAAATVLAGCGGEEKCLSRAEIDARVTKIADGFEYTQAEVDAKREQILDVRARACEGEL